MRRLGIDSYRSTVKMKGVSGLSRVKQWPVFVSPYGRRSARGKSLPPRRQEEASKTRAHPVENPDPANPVPRADGHERPAAGTKSQTAGPVRGVKTTGIFQVPGDTVIQLVVAIGSFAPEEQTAAIRVRRVVDEELQPVFFRLVRIQAGGAQRVVVDGLGGEWIEVEVMLPSDQLVPTAAVTQFFPADAGILVLVYKAPSDFIEV